MVSHSSGIGLETAKHLFSKGAKVYFSARSEAKANTTKEYIFSESPNVAKENLLWLQLDMLDIQNILAVVDEIKLKERKVDILSTCLHLNPFLTR